MWDSAGEAASAGGLELLDPTSRPETGPDIRPDARLDARPDDDGGDARRAWQPARLNGPWRAASRAESQGALRAEGKEGGATVEGERGVPLEGRAPARAGKRRGRKGRGGPARPAADLRFMRSLPRPPGPARLSSGLSSGPSSGSSSGASSGPSSGAAAEPVAAQAASPTRVRYEPLDAQGRPRCFAALDLGTNNCRLLIAAPTRPGRFRVVNAYSRIVRLGEGLGAGNRLSETAMARAFQALKVCADRLGGHSIHAARLIATEACRRTENGADFLAGIEADLGLRLEIIDRATEARLAAEGCSALIDRQALGAVLFDIGGGSTEIVLVDRRRARRGPVSEQIAAWTSLPIGVVTLSERHGGRDVTADGFEAMVAEVSEAIAGFAERDWLAPIWRPAVSHLLGTSGTVTTLAGIHLGLPRYDRRQVDGAWMGDGDIDRVIGSLLSLDYEGRAASPCVGRDRADLVMAGCAILEAIRRQWPSPRMRIADRGLREGMLLQMMQAAGVWTRAAEPAAGMVAP